MTGSRLYLRLLAWPSPVVSDVPALQAVNHDGSAGRTRVEPPPGTHLFATQTTRHLWIASAWRARHAGESETSDTRPLAGRHNIA